MPVTGAACGLVRHVPCTRPAASAPADRVRSSRSCAVSIRRRSITASSWSRPVAASSWPRAVTGPIAPFFVDGSEQLPSRIRRSSAGSPDGVGGRVVDPASAQHAVFADADQGGLGGSGQRRAAVGHRDLVDHVSVGQHVGLDADLSVRVLEPEEANGPQLRHAIAGIPGLPRHPARHELPEPGESAWRLDALSPRTVS
jgi:hypothetical protein